MPQAPSRGELPKDYQGTSGLTVKAEHRQTFTSVLLFDCETEGIALVASSSFCPTDHCSLVYRQRHLFRYSDPNPRCILRTKDKYNRVHNLDGTKYVAVNNEAACCATVQQRGTATSTLLSRRSLGVAARLYVPLMTRLLTFLRF